MIAMTTRSSIKVNAAVLLRGLRITEKMFISRTFAGRVIRLSWFVFYGADIVKNDVGKDGLIAVVQLKLPPTPNVFVAIGVQFATGSATFVDERTRYELPSVPPVPDNTRFPPVADTVEIVG